LNDGLRTTLSEHIKSGWQSNPALRTLIHDYTKYHIVLVIAGGFLILVLLLFSIFCWIRFKKVAVASKFIWPFEKKVYFSFGSLSIIVALFFGLFVVANASTVLNPLPGFTSLADTTTMPTDSVVGQALNQWVQSGNNNFPPILKQKVKDRILWQRPKAIICGVFLILLVLLSVRFWDALIKKTRRSRSIW
jgi:hypothetical protein